MKSLKFLTALVLFLTPALASASGGTPVSEASSAMLFVLGVLGVLIGRQASKQRRRRED